MFKLNGNAKPFRPSNKQECTNSKVDYLNKGRSNQNNILKDKINILSNSDNKSKLDNSNENKGKKERNREVKIDENSNKNIITPIKSKRYFKKDHRSNGKNVFLHNKKTLEYNDYPSAISVFEYLNI